MKKMIAVLAVVWVMSFVGCGANEKQEAVLEYINNDVVDMGTLENRLLASYDSVTGDNYSSDIETYTEFTTNTAELARKLNDKAVEISTEISDEEILEVHRLYMNYSNKFLGAVNLMISAIENQDMSQIVEANEKLNEANNLALDYKKALSKLAKEYNIELQ